MEGGQQAGHGQEVDSASSDEVPAKEKLCRQTPSRATCKTPPTHTHSLMRPGACCSGHSSPGYKVVLGEWHLPLTQLAQPLTVRLLGSSSRLDQPGQLLQQLQDEGCNVSSLNLHAAQTQEDSSCPGDGPRLRQPNVNHLKTIDQYRGNYTIVSILQAQSTCSVVQLLMGGLGY